MTRYLLIIFLLILCGCTYTISESPEVTPKCRHLALFGALTWQNLTGEKTVISAGPSRNTRLWHAQAAIIDPDYVIRRWLVWDGETWQVGEQEPFIMYELFGLEEFFHKTLKGRFGGVGFEKYKKKKQPTDRPDHQP